MIFSGESHFSSRLRVRVTVLNECSFPLARTVLLTGQSELRLGHGSALEPIGRGDREGLLEFARQTRSTRAEAAAARLQLSPTADLDSGDHAGVARRHSSPRLVLVADYELRITTRCLEEDLEVPRDTPISELLDQPILKALIKDRATDPDAGKTIGPEAGSETIRRLGYGHDHRGATWWDPTEKVVWLWRPQGAESNWTHLRTCLREEPPDHAMGRSRGGMSTQIHQLVDGRGRRLVIAVTPGQAGDSPMLQPLLAHLAVDRSGRRRPRTRPEAVIGDKAYSSRAIRADLRSRGIRALIPQPSDQIAHRKRRGSAGGRPPAFDAKTYEGRNVTFSV